MPYRSDKRPALSISHKSIFVTNTLKLLQQIQLHGPYFLHLRCNLVSAAHFFFQKNFWRKMFYIHNKSKIYIYMM